MKAANIFDTNYFPLSVTTDLGTPNFVMKWFLIAFSTPVVSFVAMWVVPKTPVFLCLILTMYLYQWEVVVDLLGSHVDVFQVGRVVWEVCEFLMVVSRYFVRLTLGAVLRLVQDISVHLLAVVISFQEIQSFILSCLIMSWKM